MTSFARITGDAVCSCIEAEGTKYVPGMCVLMKTHHQVQDLTIRRRPFPGCGNAAGKLRQKGQ